MELGCAGVSNASVFTESVVANIVITKLDDKIDKLHPNIDA